MEYHHTNGLSGPSLGAQRVIPRLRPKPSTNRLRPLQTTSSTSSIPSSSTQYVPRSASAEVQHDTSIYTRKDRKSTALPKPMTPVERTITPVSRVRTAPPPPTRETQPSAIPPPKRTFSTIPTTTHTSSDAIDRTRRIVRKPGSAEKAYTLTGSAGRAGAMGSSQSRIPSHGSIQASSMTLGARKLSAGSSVPRLMTDDLPTHQGLHFDSSPSTRYTDSPFSHISTPTSTSSHSPGPAAMLRSISSSPGRPMGRARNNSIASIEVSLDTVREASTSASSDSTIRANEKGKGRIPERPNVPQTLPPALQVNKHPSGSASAPSTPFMGAKSPKVAASPKIPAPQTLRRPSAPGIPTRANPTPTGLGVSLGGPNALSKARSRSVSSGLPTRNSKEAPTPPLPTPPLPSPGLPKTLPQKNILATPTVPAKSSTIPQPTKKPSTERSASPTKSHPPKASATSRLNFFTRGRKNSEEKPNKLTRPGPAAGTGFEGYGPFGKASRGRSGSISNTGTRSRSGSANSTGGTRSRSGSRPGSRTSDTEGEVDSYFAQRLNPVVIVGGGGVQSGTPTASPGSVEMARTGSNNSFLEPRERSGSVLSISTREASPNSDTPSVARRRAQDNRTITPIPAPINTTRAGPSPSPVSSLVSSARKQSFDKQEVAAAPKSKLWNFFGRSHAKQPTPETPPNAPAAFAPAMTRTGSFRNGGVQAHYLNLTPDEEEDAAAIMSKLRQARQQQVNSSSPPAPSYTPRQRQGSIPLQEPVYLPSKTPSPLYGIPDDAERARERLRQAKALERTKVQTTEANKPLSATPRMRPRLPTLKTQVSPPPKPPTPPVLAPEQEFQVPWESFQMTPTDDPVTARPDFEEYDPKDLAGLRARLFAVDTPQTAITMADLEWPIRNEAQPPMPVHQEQQQQEEEEWPEYANLADFLGTFGEHPETKPEKRPQAVKRSNTVQSTASSLGAPFQYSSSRLSTVSRDSNMKELRDSVNIDTFTDDEDTTPPQGIFAKDSPTIRPIAYKDLEIPVLKISRYSGPSDMLPHTPQAQKMVTPTTPFSISSFIRGYGDSRTNSRVLSTIEPTSTPMVVENSPPPKKHRKTMSSGTKSIDTVSSRSSISSQLQVDEMKVRPWALLASRWLSFDRVLVSPAHEQMQGTKNGRVLVVDGLGTDDWSFYCALSYPGAKVYNLTQTPPGPPGSVPASPSVPRPVNHKQVYHPNFTCAFPFPKGFFDVISFRFLPSSSQRYWSLVLSECKRVLAPGGHLEITVLDADLVPTGPRGKRAVDLVKAIMARENESSLPASSKLTSKPASERVLRILQKKGFEDISKCFVGLPVVGKVDGSIVGTSAEGSVDITSGERETSPDDPDSINEVISKVGRWWYSRCYERVITNGGEAMGRSMWCDKGLLRECSKKKTNFKMLICYATKPAAKAPTGGNMGV